MDAADEYETAWDRALMDGLVDAGDDRLRAHARHASEWIPPEYSQLRPRRIFSWTWTVRRLINVMMASQ